MIIIAIVIFVILAMLLGALLVGTASAWFLNLPFSYGWHMAWEKPWVLLGFAIITIVLAGMLRSSD